MNILFLAEGDPTTRDSWSGICKSVLTRFRASGHCVQPADVDLYGVDRLAAAAGSLALPRERWRTRYRLGAGGFERRSRNAIAAMQDADPAPDIVFQVGATFHPGDGAAPYVIYCDSNIWVAEMKRETGQSYANWLTTAEIERAKERERRVYEGAARVFTISERLRRSFLEDVGLPPDRVVAVHAGPNFENGAPPDPRAEAPSNEAPRVPTILYVGRHFERKGGQDLLEAFGRVRRSLPEARLVIVGPDALNEVPAGVQWLGFLNKDDPRQAELLDDAYRRAHVFCLPTLWEPFGIVFIEAMFHGLPCVATNVWAISEIVEDGVTGALVPPGDVAGLAERLVRILGDPELASRMGERGRARAESHFTWEATVARMLSVMEEVSPSPDPS